MKLSFKYSTKLSEKELKEVLELHKKWLNDEEGGVSANLSSANLKGIKYNYLSL